MGNALTADAAAALGWHEGRVRAPARAIASGPTFASTPTRPGAAQPAPALSRREKVLLIGFAVLLHAAALNAFNTPTAPLPAVKPPEVPPLMIELTRPAPPPVLTPPEPVVKQPVVAPPPVVPVVDEFATRPPPRKAPPPPKVVPKVVEPPPAPVPVAPPAPPTPAPVVAAPAPAPVAATPPSAHADYLHNPAPEYPDFARRRGWEGTVVLRVRVRANGAPSEIQIEQSSGRDVLDTAARQAVARWTFVPAKRGDVAEEGWVSVPIGFSLS
jgi:protein TonB